MLQVCVLFPEKRNCDQPCEFDQECQRMGGPCIHCDQSINVCTEGRSIDVNIHSILQELARKIAADFQNNSN